MERDLERDLEAVAERAAVAALAAMMPKLTGELAKEIREILEGVNGGGNPVSPHCERVLTALDKGQIKCWDFRGTRSAVMCLAFKIMEEEKLSSFPSEELGRFFAKNAPCDVMGKMPG